jgi:hypothetical protein
MVYVLVTERGQRAFDGLSLRVQDPLLGTNEDANLQRCSQL